MTKKTYIDMGVRTVRTSAMQPLALKSFKKSFSCTKIEKYLGVPFPPLKFSISLVKCMGFVGELNGMGKN